MCVIILVIGKEVGNRGYPLFVDRSVTMKEKLEKIRECIEPEMKKLDIIIDSIEYVRKSNYNSLEIILDKLHGLDMDSIVEATNIINPIIDKLDLIDEEYILDISSKERGESNE